MSNSKKKKKGQVRSLKWYAAMALSCSIPIVVLGLLLVRMESGHVEHFEDLADISDGAGIFTTVGAADRIFSVSNNSFMNNESDTIVVETQDPVDEVKEKYASMTITIPYGDETETIDSDKIAEWVSIDDKTGSVTINEGAVKEYVSAWAKKHDTMGQSRKINTYSGREITVKGGNYGWWTNKGDTIKELVAMLKEGEGGTFNPVYYSQAMKYGNDDIGDSYVEVDLDAQQVYVYKNGSVVCKSDCVSGKVSNGNMTPNGTYAITYKERNSKLVGEGYTSEVSYWMPFNGNIGLHDASWRDEFGGELYLNGGSHGCVNLPPSKAAEIYGIVEKGEAVIVHGGKQAAEAPVLTEQQQLELLQQQQAAEAQAAQQAAEAEQAQRIAEQEKHNQEVAAQAQAEAQQQAAEAQAPPQ